MNWGLFSLKSSFRRKLRLKNCYHGRVRRGFFFSCLWFLAGSHCSCEYNCVRMCRYLYNLIFIPSTDNIRVTNLLCFVAVNNTHSEIKAEKTSTAPLVVGTFSLVFSKYKIQNPNDNTHSKKCKLHCTRSAHGQTSNFSQLSPSCACLCV